MPLRVQFGFKEGMSTNMTWKTQFTYLNQEPSLVVSMSIGLLLGIFIGVALYILFKYRGGKTTSYLFVLTPIIGGVLAYITYSKSMASYSILTNSIKEIHKVHTLEGKWSTSITKIGRYYAERLVIGGKEVYRIDPSRYVAYQGCLAKPFGLLLPRQSKRNNLMKISYIVFPNKGPIKSHNSSVKMNLDLICIFEVTLRY